ncbi:hypothetical protein FNV43_RR03565 [Rhamnella rubrinervis]|uniref:Uncharacterized protein n=1 Tax=Rhamnella rubrinervis TaxID=2594499 RepID=A0A8K0HIP0_9ROSA|nr:hypothetical protein FNV43_RR03565 [Rhamnella rubrinervis]
MYVTRRLSTYRKSLASLSDPPPEGPNSGILVIQDEEAMPTRCLGLCETDRIKELPLPQNRSLELYYAQGISYLRTLHFHNVFFVPVLNQPLSSKLYYAIHPYGKDRGEAITSSEEDLEACCFSIHGKDVPPQRLDPKNKYQQFEISLEGGNVNPLGSGFTAKSLDGFPPNFLGRKGWKLISSSSPGFELSDDAQGLDAALRACLPNFDFPLAEDEKSKPVAVLGKWYCPFMFIKEGTPQTLKDEMSRSMYYEMTLEQSWELIFAKENDHNQGNAIVVDIDVQTEAVMVGKREAVIDESNIGDGVVWFRSFSNVGEETSVGLSIEIVERMKWEQKRVGWITGDERKVRVERAEECGGPLGGEWNKFGCFVLTERFVLKRMNGSLVLTHDFKHTHQIRSKWE